MSDLLSLETLAKWTQNDTADVAADPFAIDLIEKVSEMVRFIGGHPEWTLEGTTRAPFDVLMIVLNVCKRSYENPGRVVQESVGPLSERVIEAQALFTELSEAERKTIARYNPDGDPLDNDGPGDVFVISTTRGDETTLPQTSPLYLGDDQQHGLINSADPREWMIPMFSPGDPGDDSNYD